MVAGCETAAIVHYLRKPAVMASTEAVSTPVPVAAPVAPPPQRHVTLNVERNGQSLRLKWDRNAAAVREATHAILHIEDGTHQSQLDLDSTLLDSGLLSYWPETRNVAFRMELFTPGRTVTESVRATNVTPPQSRRHASSQGDADRSEDDDARPSPFASPKTGRPAPALSIEASPRSTGLRDEVVPLPPPAPEPEATEVTEPARGSFLGRFVSKIPLLRKLVKHPQEAPDPNR
ncbi:hypothetical protein SBA4_6480008 [Candidatus Sulfopaludibacter sp. SbA4]|nr:hypothetical protein SBA4_6480008 [Candidatus Sulfopaludibacter sp. SbA4]